jgi:predicted transcriptional regulator of viral defense system
MDSAAVEKATVVFRRHGGVLRTKQALALGVHPRTLYEMRDREVVEQVSRGIYRLATLPALGQPDLVTVALRVPRAVVCLISALSFHELTTEIPHEVQIALPRGTKRPVLEHPPLRVFHFSGPALTEGIETLKIDSIPVRIYSPAKTVADSFRFRNKIGLDVAIEALDLCLKGRRAQPADILRYARLCRVEKVMMPYLQARL